MRLEDDDGSALDFDIEVLEFEPIEFNGVYIVAPSLLGQRIAFKLYHEWFDDDEKDDEDYTVSWDDAEWHIDEELGNIRGEMMKSIQEMLEQNDLSLI